MAFLSVRLGPTVSFRLLRGEGSLGCPRDGVGLDLERLEGELWFR